MVPQIDVIVHMRMRCEQKFSYDDPDRNGIANLPQKKDIYYYYLVIKYELVP